MKKLVVLFLAISSVAFGQSEFGFSIMGQPTIVKNFTPWTGQYVVTSTFSVGIQAVNDDYTFNSNSFTFGIYRNGEKMDSPGVSFLSGYQIPSSGVVTVGLPQGELFKLLHNNQTTLNVTATFTGPTANPQFLSPAVYAIGLESISLIEGTATTRTAIGSMAGLAAWQTAAIQLDAGDIRVTAVPEPHECGIVLSIASLGILLWARQKRVQPRVLA